MNLLWRRKPHRQPCLPPPERPELSIEADSLTDTGCRRANNQDCILFVAFDDPALEAAKGCLALVADGMGGHVGGTTASRLAVDTISAVYQEADTPLQEALHRAFTRANAAVFQAANLDEDLKGMGTTCTALVICEDMAYHAHVGDSRIYMLRGDHVYLLTQDDSMVMDMVRQGEITLEDARRHPDRNLLLRALGTQPEVDISTWPQPLPIKAGDQFLLCSDGLYDLVSEDEIGQLAHSDTPREACRKLVDLARERGGHDNISVVLLRVHARRAE
jgi:serine/threonine protein phosphatase PrpC